jgi:hypothetical protein
MNQMEPFPEHPMSGLQAGASQGRAVVGRAVVLIGELGTRSGVAFALAKFVQVASKSICQYCR